MATTNHLRDRPGIAELQLGPGPLRDRPGIAELQLGIGKTDPRQPLPETETKKPGWYSRGYLPHFDAEGLIQHITFHLGDSLPEGALEWLEASIAEMPEDERKWRRRQNYQVLLDAGHGSCVLRYPETARMVEEALLHFDGQRYRLLAWVIMPNHVHVLIEPLPGFDVGRIVQSWKSFTARRINAWLAGPSDGPECRAGARRSQGRQSMNGRFRSLWQRDYWDRFIRNERHLQTAIRYIEGNPVAAGLVGAAENWRWGSARSRPERTSAEQ